MKKEVMGLNIVSVILRQAKTNYSINRNKNNKGYYLLYTGARTK